MIKLRSLLLLILLNLSLQAAAQHTSASDTMELHKVMLIPYDPRYYLSDADRDIMEQSKTDPERFRSDFRHNIDRHVQRAIGRSYVCISLLNDTTDALQETLYTIMGRTGYRYEKALPVTPRKVDFEKASSREKIDSKTHEDSKTATSYIPVKHDAVYMHAVVSKPKELFEKINEAYDADYFVFLTQFDIKTNYNSCMDIARKIYRREVMVHFSIYDKEGKVIAGSYATSFFPSDSNNANNIIGDCFPEIAAYIAGCLP